MATKLVGWAGEMVAKREAEAALARQQEAHSLMYEHLGQDLYKRYKLQDYEPESQKAKPEDDFCEDNTKEIENSS